MTDLRSHVPSARHVGIDEVPFVINPVVGARMRVLHASEADDVYVVHGFMPAGLQVQTHRHTGPVVALTLSGSWAYRENDFVNRAGSYLYEPIGSVHTLFVPSDNTEDTEMWSVVYGNTEYLDENDDVTYVSNWKAMLQLYYEGCEAAGLRRPDGILL